LGVPALHFFIRLFIAIFSDVSRARSYAEMENRPDDEPTVSTAAPQQHIVERTEVTAEPLPKQGERVWRLLRPQPLDIFSRHATGRHLPKIFGQDYSYSSSKHP